MPYHQIIALDYPQDLNAVRQKEIRPLIFQWQMTAHSMWGMGLIINLAWIYLSDFYVFGPTDTPSYQIGVGITISLAIIGLSWLLFGLLNLWAAHRLYQLQSRRILMVSAWLLILLPTASYLLQLPLGISILKQLRQWKHSADKD